LKIGIDARSIGNKICGVSRVAFCQIKALSSIDSENEYIIYTDKLDAIPSLSDNFKVVRTDCDRMKVWNDHAFSKFLYRDNLDIFHSMHSWLPVIVPAKVGKLVTIYDIFTVTDPDFFARYKPFHRIFREYFRALTKMTINRAKAIVTISKYCAHEIKTVFNANDKRIEVVYLSPGILPDNTSRRPDKIIESNYLFYLGNFRSYKNVSTLIRGYACFIKHTPSPVDLVIAGNDDSKAILDLCNDLGIKNRVHFMHNPSDEIVNRLYTHADAFVFPSLYEGFGIPPIEAMSYGIPVIISDADALVETSGEAALVFDKTSPEDLAAKIAQVLTDAELRKNLVQRGYECALRYTWENSAKQLRAVYESI
jgi:glycosyltransferase involved in cell wall biosynthesis